MSVAMWVVCVCGVYGVCVVCVCVGVGWCVGVWGVRACVI